ncbi:MAG: DUF3397 domain-containing protein [Psychrobacter sp.]|nr:DUF3397 domain-containing protein [Psychrobacter sp.]
MLIPKYWAQYKQRFESKPETNNTSKQATIKRYGWSDNSQTDALIHAKARVNEAHNRWLDGEDIVRRERAEQYNQSNAIPIREAIISKSIFSNNTSNTQVIVTRNSYGAQVANIDNIAIIDVDNDDLLQQRYPDDYHAQGLMGISITDNNKPSSMKRQVWGFVIVSVLIASVIAWQSLSWLWLIGVMLLGTTLLWWQASKNEEIHYQANQQKHEAHLAELQPFITSLIEKRVTSHPNEQFRLYETPAGFRLIAVHDLVVPSEKVVAEWFDYFHADSNYVRLCQAQQCFRARLTPKPWRMNEVNDHKLDKQIPANDFWFIDTYLDDAILDEKLDAMDEEQYDAFERQQAELVARQQWIENYDNFAKNYKSCRYVRSFGNQQDNNSSATKAINEFVDWHDRACQVDKELPMG